MNVIPAVARSARRAGTFTPRGKIPGSRAPRVSRESKKEESVSLVAWPIGAQITLDGTEMIPQAVGLQGAEALVATLSAQQGTSP